MHKWYMIYLECLGVELANQKWYETYVGGRAALKNKTMALVRFDREIILAQKAFDMAECVRNSPITGDSNDMSNNPKFLSFGGDMYVRADQFVRPPLDQTFSGGTGREAVTKVTFHDSSWFEVGNHGYKAWPLGEMLVKVVRPVDGEVIGSLKYKVELDLSQVDALLEGLNSKLSDAKLLDDLAQPAILGEAIFEPQPSLSIINNGTINISGAEPTQESLAIDAMATYHYENERKNILSADENWKEAYRVARLRAELRKQQ